MRLTGHCALTHANLSKCEACMKKDEALVLRKRKDASNWTASDVSNNQRLLVVRTLAFFSFCFCFIHLIFFIGEASVGKCWQDSLRWNDYVAIPSELYCRCRKTTAQESSRIRGSCSPSTPPPSPFPSPHHIYQKN